MPRASDRLRGSGLLKRGKALLRAVQEEDDAILEALLRLSRSHRIFAPLAFTVSAFALLLDGVKLLISNWRLLLVQVIPALLIWAAMLDLKLHVLHGRSFHQIRGPILVPIALAIIALTVVAFFLNAVFAFAIAGPRPPTIRPAVAEARAHTLPVVLSGSIVGAALAVATTVSPRWGPPWFSVSLGVVIGVMMVIYVAVPARLIGAKTSQSRRDKLTTSALSGALGATVCTPPYILGRIGVLMLGTRYLLIPGIVVMVLGFTLQAGATGAVRAIKMSVRLATGKPAESLDAASEKPRAAP